MLNWSLPQYSLGTFAYLINIPESNIYTADKRWNCIITSLYFRQAFKTFYTAYLLRASNLLCEIFQIIKSIISSLVPLLL